MQSNAIPPDDSNTFFPFKRYLDALDTYLLQKLEESLRASPNPIHPLSSSSPAGASSEAQNEVEEEKSSKNKLLEALKKPALEKEELLERELLDTLLKELKDKGECFYKEFLELLLAKEKMNQAWYRYHTRAQKINSGIQFADIWLAFLEQVALIPKLGVSILSYCPTWLAVGIVILGMPMALITMTLDALLEVVNASMEKNSFARNLILGEGSIRAGTTTVCVLIQFGVGALAAASSCVMPFLFLGMTLVSLAKMAIQLDALEKEMKTLEGEESSVNEHKKSILQIQADNLKLIINTTALINLVATGCFIAAAFLPPAAPYLLVVGLFLFAIAQGYLKYKNGKMEEAIQKENSMQDSKSDDPEKTYKNTSKKSTFSVTLQSIFAKKNVPVAEKLNEYKSTHNLQLS